MTEVIGLDPAPDDRPRRSPRRWGAAAVAAALVVTTWFIVARTDHRSAGSSKTPALASTTSTTAASRPGGKAPAGPASGDGVNDHRLGVWAAGYSRWDHGVPVGYERTENGARAAAANWATVTGQEWFLLEERREAAIRVVAVDPDSEWARSVGDPPKAPGIDGTAVPSDLEVNAASLGQVLTSYAKASASVEVYTVGLWQWLSGDRPEANTAKWTTFGVELRWVDGDWKVAGYRVLRTGPTPVSTEAASTPDEVAAAMGTGS
jgi:hypothetical protein